MYSQPAGVSSQVPPVCRTRLISADNFVSGYLLPLHLVAGLIRAGPNVFVALLDQRSEVKRARLTARLYGRSHTHDIGVQVAATCAGASLRATAGLVGNVLYDVSRWPYKAPSHDTHGGSGKRQASLDGSRRTRDRVTAHPFHFVGPQ
jgi:hypothetical protein